MDAVRTQLQKPVVAGLIGAVLGLVLGLLIGWQWWPVEYEGAGPVDLLPEYRVEYLGMAAESYAKNGNLEVALSRYQSLGAERQLALVELTNNPRSFSPEAVKGFSVAMQAAEAMGQTIPEQAAPEQPAPEAQGAGFPWLWLCGIGLLVFLGLAGVYLLRGRNFNRPATQANVPLTSPDEWSEHESARGEPPMTQFMATYKLGDDLFDDSFSIENPAGEFMGECGVGISEVIGVGDPKRVTAFEVWLFDKNDIQTVTKVLMSAHAFNDDGIKLRLSTKGEPVLAEQGAEAVLETQTLRLVARVVEMSYGEGPLPDESFLERFLLDLAIWPKEVTA